MFHSPSGLSLIAMLLMLAGVAGCASGPPVSNASRSREVVEQSEARLLIRTGSIELSVKDPHEHIARVERVVETAGGFVEHSRTDEAWASFELRIPAVMLESSMDEIAQIGKVQSRRIDVQDVTDQYGDLEARLRTKEELRFRMRALFERASEMKDLLKIEKEIARIQAEIETMQSRLARFDSQVELASLSIRLEREQVLGPLGLIGYWTGWAFAKLFVIQ